MSRKKKNADGIEADKHTHAESNAEGYAEGILELYRAYKALSDGAETAEVEGEEYTDVDAVRERAQESALSVEVRGPWHVPGSDGGARLDEYRILLSTGGPALQIVGEIGDHGEPDGEPTMQIQDRGTPWTDYYPDTARAADDWDDALGWFVGCFYFGE